MVCAGSTGANHCIRDWFDGHNLRLDQTMALLGSLLEDNLPTKESCRVMHQRVGLVSVNSLANMLLEDFLSAGNSFICDFLTVF